MNEKHFSSDIYQQIYKPFTILEGEQKIYDPAIRQYVSQGFFVQERKHGKTLMHGGNNGDYDSKFGYSPEKKAGYIILTNSNLGDEFVRAMEEYLLGEK